MIREFLERAASKWLGWKIERELCSTTNIATLAGEQLVNGEMATYGMHVLLTGQTDPKQNGPHVVQNAGWVRPPDYDATGGARKGTTIVVVRGTNAGEWRLISPTAGDITVDQTETTWAKVGPFASMPGGGGGTDFGSAPITNLAGVENGSAGFYVDVDGGVRCVAIAADGSTASLDTLAGGTARIGGTYAGTTDVGRDGGTTNIRGATTIAGPSITANSEQIDRLPIATSAAGSAALAFGSGINLLTSAATARSLPNITASDVGRIIAVRLASGGTCVVTPDGSDTVNGAASDTIDATSGRVVRSYLATTTSTWETLS